MFVQCFVFLPPPFSISQLYLALLYAQDFGIFFPRTPESVMYRGSSVSMESDKNGKSLHASNYTMGLYPVFLFLTLPAAVKKPSEVAAGLVLQAIQCLWNLLKAQE